METEKTGTQRDVLGEVPCLKGLPWVGNFFNLNSKRFHHQIRSWCDRYGSIYSYKMGPTVLYVISDLTLIHEMLKRRPHDFRRTKRIEVIFKELGVHGVFSAEGENWRRQRRLIMPAFHQGHLKEFFGTLCEITRRLKTRWEIAARKGLDFEICKDLTRFTVDVTTRIAFDYDMNTLEKGEDVIQNHLEHMFPAVGRRVLALFPYWRYIKLPKDRALDQALRQVRQEMGRIINSSRQSLATSSQETRYKPKNMVESLLTSKDADSTGFTMEEILANVFTLLIAGEDTTATSLAWALTFMIEHPEVQKRMKQEALQVLGESELLLHYEQLDCLNYIEAVILEAMRLKPVAPFLFLEACHELTLGNLKFPQGAILNAMLSYPATQEKYFSHPNEFRPERWIEEERDPSWNHDVKAFIPFGGGARVCPGRTLAMMEMKSVLAMFCRNFEVLKPGNGRRWKEEFRFSAVPINFWTQIRLSSGVSSSDLNLLRC